MTFMEFKKTLLDAEITLPKFCRLIRVSDKNIQSYKKKGNVPNTIAVIATCFVRLHQQGIDYRFLIDQLQLIQQTKKGGFVKKRVDALSEKKINENSKPSLSIQEEAEDKE